MGHEIVIQPILLHQQFQQKQIEMDFYEAAQI